MAGIICAIRGGPASQPTVQQAIALAKQTDLPLSFLYVVSLDFLSRTESSRVRIISKEMHQMGEFILLNAQSAAEAKGVSANCVVRHGNVGDEIIGLSQELSADYVVLGRPRGEHEEDVFTHERLREFSERIERESGARVILAEEGER